MKPDPSTLEWQKERWKDMDKCVTYEPDPVVATVMKRMSDRSQEGIEKYGCTMMRDDISPVGWVDHAIEELLDAAVYLERLKLDLS
jgi:hypothetical protein